MFVIVGCRHLVVVVWLVTVAVSVTQLLSDCCQHHWPVMSADALSMSAAVIFNVRRCRFQCLLLSVSHFQSVSVLTAVG